jgi:hypothetical protein
MDVILALIIALAFATTFQFYKGRKLNLLLMKHYLEEIESVLKPFDKEYVWLGGYVGYRARYNRGKIEVTLTLLPRQSLLYFPISLVTSKHDKLYIVFKLKGRANETHLIQKGYYRIKPKINTLRTTTVKINNIDFEAYYNDEKTLNSLIKLVKSLPTKDIKHISISDTLFVLMKPKPDTIAENLKTLCKYLNQLQSIQD